MQPDLIAHLRDVFDADLAQLGSWLGIYARLRELSRDDHRGGSYDWAGPQTQARAVDLPGRARLAPRKVGLDRNSSCRISCLLLRCGSGQGFPTIPIQDRRMDADTETIPAATREDYKSRPGALIWFFKKSRNNWKAKSQALKVSVKRLKNQLAAVTRSREPDGGTRPPTPTAAPRPSRPRSPNSVTGSSRWIPKKSPGPWPAELHPAGAPHPLRSALCHRRGARLPRPGAPLRRLAAGRRRRPGLARLGDRSR